MSNSDFHQMLKNAVGESTYIRVIGCANAFFSKTKCGDPSISERFRDLALFFHRAWILDENPLLPSPDNTPKDEIERFIQILGINPPIKGAETLESRIESRESRGQRP